MSCHLIPTARTTGCCSGAANGGVRKRFVESFPKDASLTHILSSTSRNRALKIGPRGRGLSCDLHTAVTCSSIDSAERATKQPSNSACCILKNMCHHWYFITQCVGQNSKHVQFPLGFPPPTETTRTHNIPFPLLSL